MEKVQEHILETLYSVDENLTTCTIILKDGKGSVVGQVEGKTKDVKEKALEQALRATIEFLNL